MYYLVLMVFITYIYYYVLLTFNGSLLTFNSMYYLLLMFFIIYIYYYVLLTFNGFHYLLLRVCITYF